MWLELDDSFWVSEYWNEFGNVLGDLDNLDVNVNVLDIAAFFDDDWKDQYIGSLEATVKS